MNELEDAINNIILKEQPSIEDFENFSGLLFNDSGEVNTQSLFLVKEYFDRLQEKFDFIHNIIKDLSSVDLNPVDGGKKHFINRKDERNLISEMTEYEFVNSIEEFKNFLSTTKSIPP